MPKFPTEDAGYARQVARRRAAAARRATSRLWSVSRSEAFRVGSHSAGFALPKRLDRGNAKLKRRANAGSRPSTAPPSYAAQPIAKVFPRRLPRCVVLCCPWSVRPRGIDLGLFHARQRCRERHHVRNYSGDEVPSEAKRCRPLPTLSRFARRGENRVGHLASVCRRASRLHLGSPARRTCCGGHRLRPSVLDEGVSGVSRGSLIASAACTVGVPRGIRGGRESVLHGRAPAGRRGVPGGIRWELSNLCFCAQPRVGARLWRASRRP